MLMQRAAPKDAPCKMARWMGAHESRSRSLMPAWPSSALCRDRVYSQFPLYEFAMYILQAVKAAKPTRSDLTVSMSPASVALWKELHDEQHS